MKKITKKLSIKYVKLHKCRLRQDGSMKSEEDGGELFRETDLPEKAESNETKEIAKVTKMMESMHRKLTLKEKAHKKNIHVDHHHQPEMSERSVRNGGRDCNGQPEGSVRNMKRDGMDQLEGSVRNSHMDHLEDLIRGRDRMDHIDGSIKNSARDRVDQLEGSSKKGQNNNQREDNTAKTSDQVDKSERSTKEPSDFASKKDYLDWIEYVEGSNHHCFDRSENPEQPYRIENIDHDQISVGISEGSIEGNNDEILLLKNSKYRKNEKFEDSKGYKKRKGSKQVKDSFKNQ